MLHFFEQWSSHLFERIIRLDAYLAEVDAAASRSHSGRQHELILKIQNEVELVYKRLCEQAKYACSSDEFIKREFESLYVAYFNVCGQLQKIYDLLRYLPYPWPGSDLELFVAEISENGSDDSRWSISREADLSFSNVTIGERPTRRSDLHFPNVLTIPCTETENISMWALLAHEVGHTKEKTSAVRDEVVEKVATTSITDSQRTILNNWVEEIICDFFAASKLGIHYYLALGSHFAFWLHRENIIAPNPYYPSADERMQLLKEFTEKKSRQGWRTIEEAKDLPWNLRLEFELDGDYRMIKWEDRSEREALKSKFPAASMVEEAAKAIADSTEFKNLCGDTFTDENFSTVTRQNLFLQSGEIVAAGPTDRTSAYLPRAPKSQEQLEKLIHRTPYTRAEIVSAGILRKSGFQTNPNQPYGSGQPLKRRCEAKSVVEDFLADSLSAKDRLKRYLPYYTTIDDLIGKSIECSNIVRFFEEESKDGTIEQSGFSTRAFAVRDEEPEKETPSPEQDRILNVRDEGTQVGDLDQDDLSISIGKREIVVTPLINSDQISNTLDLRLGAKFIVPKLDRFSSFDPVEFHELEVNDPERIEKYFESITKARSDDAFILEAGQSALACTLEWLYLPPNISGVLEGRSGWARTFLNVHSTASFIHPGHKGVIVFELKNAGAKSVHLYPGTRVAQIKFTRQSRDATAYDNAPDAKYNSSNTTRFGRPWLDAEYELLARHLNNK